MFELIAGPCSAESKEQVLSIAKDLDAIEQIKWFRAGIWKPRTRPNQFEGVGAKGLKWLLEVKKTTSLKVITEVGTAHHVEKCLENGIDALWIGARTTTNPFNIQEIAEALKGINIPIFIKNPLNPDIKLWIGAIERIESAGIKSIFAIHRGFSFADNGIYRQTPYWKIPIELKRLLPQIPIICDPSHIAGNSSLIKDISQTALNIGLNGLMIEVHNNPQEALTDNTQQITPSHFKQIINELNFPSQNIDTPLYSLSTLRAEIDSLDAELLDILNQRMRICIEIAKIKKEENTSILDINRFQEILKQHKDNSKNNSLNSFFIEEILELIHEESIRMQNKFFLE